MKKLLSLFMAVMAALWVNAQTTVTFDATVDKSESAEAGECVLVKDGVTLALSNGMLGNGTEYRIYKGATLTVSAAEGNVTSIEFTCTANNTTKNGPGCFAELEGYTYEGKVGTWTGSAPEVTFTASSNQVRATQIVVTVLKDGETPVVTVAKPEASVAAGVYEAAQSVELTAEEGATIQVHHQWRRSSGVHRSYLCQCYRNHRGLGREGWRREQAHHTDLRYRS